MGLYNEIAASTLIRLILGFLFFIQGYDKVFRVGIKSVVETFKYPLGSKNIPAFFVTMAAYFTSIVELFAGAFLIIGWNTNISLYLLGIDLVMVSVAFGMLKPMWDMEHFFPRMVLLVVMLLLPESWNVLSVDELIKMFK